MVLLTGCVKVCFHLTKSNFFVYLNGAQVRNALEYTQSLILTNSACYSARKSSNLLVPCVNHLEKNVMCSFQRWIKRYDDKKWSLYSKWYTLLP